MRVHAAERKEELHGEMIVLGLGGERCSVEGCKDGCDVDVDTRKLAMDPRREQ